MSAGLVVLKPGLLTTVQDLGRYGHAALGVGTAGAMDAIALQLANALVDNSDDAPALEITLLGPRLRFERDATIALVGAEFEAKLDGCALAGWRRHRVEAGAELDLGNARRGARAYLAVRGGFAVERVLGSASVDVNAALGPFGGRALIAGDHLPIGTRVDDAERAGAERIRAVSAWSLDPRPWFDRDGQRALRWVRGAHFDTLDESSQRAVFEAEFTIAAESNRVGYRLDGPALALATPLELVTESAAFGTVQLPPGGKPIVLMAEHPTTGGYPRIGQIAAVDLPKLAQRRPGERVRFRPISLDDAQTRYLERERHLRRLLAAIAARRSA